ncbi:MAG TPA: serine hydrolase [Candidatus Angelobacter sp.]|jgi:CubicO group peptidase (beta-lactamase class C family)|nr:serine hydrolase [Candidatus Angelobacter sp.]
MQRVLMLTAFVVAMSATLASQQAFQRLDGSKITSPEIDATVTRLMRAAEVTGVGITLFNQGKVVYQKAYGFRDTEKHLPLTADSVLNGASFTKVAFAYMVMQLVDEKRLNLDRPVYQYLRKPLPEYPQYRDLAGDPRYQKITARMLLDHTSGFPNLRWLNDDHKLNINFDPGSRYAYSGEGMMLLQLVVETITGKPLEELMQERVFRPLGMSRSSMVWQKKFESDFANGYDEYGRSLGPDKRKEADAAGSMSTTLGDFSRFMQGVMLDQGLSPKTRELMLSPQIEIASKHQFPTLASETTDANRSIHLAYGLGWGLYQAPYGKAFFKEGHSDGFRNYTVCFDRQKTGIVIMTNSANGEGIFKELLETLLKNTFTPIEWEGFTPYNQLPPRAPLKQHTEITLDPQILDRYVGRYAVSPELVLIVGREDGHLIIKEGDENHLIFPEGERAFFSKTADDEVTFIVDGQGHVTSMELRTGGRTIPIKRIE